MDINVLLVLIIFVLFVYLILTESIDLITGLFSLFILIYFSSKILSQNETMKKYLIKFGLLSEENSKTPNLNISPINSETQNQSSTYAPSPSSSSQSSSESSPNLELTLSNNTPTESFTEEYMDQLIKENLQLPRTVNFKPDAQKRDLDYRSSRASKNMQNNHRKANYSNARRTAETFRDIFKEELDYEEKKIWYDYVNAPSIVS